jgi:hypothetical protein
VHIRPLLLDDEAEFIRLVQRPVSCIVPGRIRRSPSRIGTRVTDRPRSKGPVGIGRPLGGALFAGDYSWPGWEGTDWN